MKRRALILSLRGISVYKFDGLRWGLYNCIAKGFHDVETVRLNSQTAI